MGTNYYHRTYICEHCNRYDERHIGKSSAGWQFSFQGYNEEVKILSWEDWKKTLKAGGKIFNEYGEEIHFERFVKLVEDKKSERHNQYDYCLRAGILNNNDDWKDDEGYSFTLGEFS